MQRRLGDIVEVRTGFPFRKKVDPIEGGTLAVVQATNIDDVAGLRANDCIRIEDDMQYLKHLLRPNDVLLQGRGHRFGVTIVGGPIHAIAALGVLVLRPRKEVEPQYLRWLFRHVRVRDELIGLSRGSYIPFLSKGDLEELRVPVPPLPVQQQIAHLQSLHERELALTQELSQKLTQLSDAATWHAATSKAKDLS